MTLLKVKIHADGIESYCFFWFFLFLDFENFNDQTAQAGTKIVVPYRQNNTQHIKKTVCVCVCVCVCVYVWKMQTLMLKAGVAYSYR